VLGDLVEIREKRRAQMRCHCGAYVKEQWQPCAQLLPLSSVRVSDGKE
jgi:hypothetical protein